MTVIHQRGAAFVPHSGPSISSSTAPGAGLTCRSKSTTDDHLIAQFNALVVERGYKRGSKNYNKLRKKCISNEFAAYFGNESDLENWQRLCRDLGVVDVPPSITKYRKALKGICVNIYDFLDAIKDGQEIPRKKNEQDLAAYTKSTGKVFPKKAAKESGPIRALLAHIFR